MGANDDVHDQVAAKIAAHNAAILASLSKPRRRKGVAQGNRRRKGRVGIVGETALFGGLDTRAESFGQTRKRVSAAPLVPRVPLPMVRNETIRCVDCDHGLVVRAGRVICPTCGAIFGDARTLRMLLDAFPGTAVIREDDLP